MPRALEMTIRRAVTQRGVAAFVIYDEITLRPAIATPTPRPASLLPARPVVVPPATSLNSLVALLNRPGFAGGPNR